MSDSRSEAVYDEYLDALLRGESAQPEQFLKERGIDNPALLVALLNLYQHRHPTVLPPGEGVAPGETEPGAPGGESRTNARLGDFLLIRKLGEGGMGVVWLAEQMSLGRHVALKLIRGEAGASLPALARFDREARAIARLHHPNIVTIHGVGEARGCRFIAMELIEGRGLDEVMEAARSSGEPIAPVRALQWCASLASALQAAHERGVIHRDVKPSNIRIARDDRAVLLDFGLARQAGSKAVTLTEGFVGSPAYAAPEQIGRGGGEVDARTDVYGLGMVLYEALTGVSPFEGGTLEQTLHRILTEDPPPPRRVRPGLGRDVSTVVMKAIEKNPGRRYQSALALEADLRAVLELRPIAARPPGMGDRAAKWAGRNRMQAGALAAGLAGALVLAGYAGWQRMDRARAREAQASAAVAQARELIDGYAQRRAATSALAEEHHRLAKGMVSSYFTPEQDAQIDALEQRVRAVRRENERSLYTTLELLDRAEAFEADPDTVRDLRARAYLQRFLEAEVSGTPAEREMYRELVRHHDPDGRLEAGMVGQSSLTLVTDPPGARVDVFRRRVASEIAEGADARVVPVPWRGVIEGMRPGDWALEVIRASPPLEEGDLILSIDGLPVRGTVFAAGPGLTQLVRVDGVEVGDPHGARMAAAPAPGVMHRFEFEGPGGAVVREAPDLATLGVTLRSPGLVAEEGGREAKAWTGGRLTTLTLPAGLRVRATAAPMALGEASLAGASPVEDLPLEPGDYAAVVRAPGREAVRVAFKVHRGGPTRLEVALLPTGSSPEGMVRVTRAGWVGPADEEFWIARAEVTVREYFEFLNDPATLAAVDASPVAIRYPLDYESATGKRDESGRFTLPEGWEWDWPIIFVSWHDAAAYCEWLTARRRGGGAPERYALPTIEQWMRASAPPTGARFHFGDTFRPKWVSSCFSRPRPDPEPVGSFPIDQSVLGVMDLAGSVSEWSSSKWRDGYDYLRHMGGSWGTGDPDQFGVYGGNGLLPDRRAGVVGFRVVMTRDAGASR